MKINGRYFQRPTVEASYSPETQSVCIRLNCKINLHEWVEIEISEAEFKGIMNSCRTTGCEMGKNTNSLVLLYESYVKHSHLLAIIGDKVEELTTAFGINGGYQIVVQSTGQRLFVDRIYTSNEEAQSDLRKFNGSVCKNIETGK